uniref:C2H2-type domain-containing protein n=1 Tax=Globodera rostochiensis TaxID=31243 RepID=A0A914ID45_GLORO
MFHEFDQDGSAETSATFDQHKMNGFDQPDLDEINSEISETSTICPTFDDNWTIETEETNDSWKNGKIKAEFVNDETKSANFGQFCAVAIKEEILEISELDEMIANEVMLRAEAAENAKLEKMAQFNAKNQIEKGKNSMKKCARHEEKIEVKVGKCEWAECDQEFANDNQLYDHIRITHIGELNSKNCGQHCIDDDDAADTSSRFACKWKNCDHSPRRGDAQRKFVWLLNHIFVWHLPKAETHICVFVGCKMRFKKLTALTAHLHTVHAERLTPKKRGQKRQIKKGNDSDDDIMTKVQKKERRSEEKI